MEKWCITYSSYRDGYYANYNERKETIIYEGSIEQFIESIGERSSDKINVIIHFAIKL